MGNYEISSIVEAIERSVAMMESDPYPPRPCLIRARSEFLRHLSVVLREWVSQPQHTAVDEHDDIL